LTEQSSSNSHGIKLHHKTCSCCTEQQSTTYINSKRQNILI